MSLFIVYPSVPQPRTRRNLAVFKKALFVYFPEFQGLISKDISGIYTDFHKLSRVEWQ